MDQVIEHLLRKLHSLCLGRRVHPIPRTPEMAASQSQTICKRRLSLVLPGGNWDRNLTIRAQPQGQQGDEREQPPQDRGCASTHLVRPLALGCQPELGSSLRTGALDRPAHDDPRQDVPWGRLQVGTAERCHPQLRRGIADDDQPNLDRGQARRVPQRGVREAPQRCALAPVPVYCHSLPGRIRAFCPGLQAPLAVPLGGFETALALRLRPRLVIARRIPAQARDHGHLTLHAGQRQRDRRTAAIDAQHQRPPGPPAACVPPPLSDPIHAGLMPSLWGLIGGPAPRGEERQRPHAPGSRPRDQAHHHPPLQPNAAEDMLPGGAHRSALAAFGRALPAAAAFPRVVGSQHNGCPWEHQAGDEPSSEDPAGLARGPRGPDQDAMVVGEVARAAQPPHP
jgi:hypothetical protein